MSWKIKGKDDWGDPIEFTFDTEKELEAFYSGFYSFRTNEASLDDESIEEVK